MQEDKDMSDGNWLCVKNRNETILVVKKKKLVWLVTLRHTKYFL